MRQDHAANILPILGGLNDQALRWHFAAGENSAARNAELVRASLALSDAAGSVGVDGSAIAPGAERLTAVVGEADCLEAGMGLIVRHAKQGR